MSLFRGADHKWSQQHLSHYVEGDLGARARRRLDRHAEDCVDCGRGILAMRALVRLIPGLEERNTIRAPAGIFSRIHVSDATGGLGGAASGAPQDS
jgi:Putative zinc-finger